MPFALEGLRLLLCH